jgi:hypothetical protein
MYCTLQAENCGTDPYLLREPTSNSIQVR